MLEVSDLDVFYGPVQALRGVNLRVEAGEIVALLGSNGAGKTTTLRSISGLLSPARGSITFEGKRIDGLTAQRIIRFGIAHMPEGRELFPELTVLENLRLGHWSRRKERAALEERIERMFMMFPRLKERATQHAATMSGGEQQMLTVSRALISEPRLLLVDELSLGLAPIVVSQLFEVIADVNRQGTAILLVEQFVNLALQRASRAYVLAKGSVVLEGKAKDLLESPDLMSAYLGDAGTTHAETSAEVEAPPRSRTKTSSRKPGTTERTKTRRGPE